MSLSRLADVAAPPIRTSAGLVELSLWAWVASHIAAKRCTNLLTLVGSWKSVMSTLSVIILACASMSDELIVGDQPIAVWTTWVRALSARIWKAFVMVEALRVK